MAVISPEHHRVHCRVQHRVSNHVLSRTINKLQSLQIIEQPRVRGAYVKLNEMASTDNTGNTDRQTIHQNQPAAASLCEPKMNPVMIWCDTYKSKYGTSYEILKKDAGMLKNFSKGRSEEKVRILFACYLAIEDSLYKAQRHPLSLFFRDLAKINQAAQSGVNPSLPARDPFALIEKDEK